MKDHESSEEFYPGQSSMKTKAIAATSLGLLAFEQSPLNEIIRTNIGANVLDSSESAVTVGLAVSAATFAIEAVSGVAIAYGVHENKNVIEKVRSKLSLSANKDDEKPSFILDSLTSLGLGAGVLVAKKGIEGRDKSTKEGTRRALGASALIASFSGAVGYLAAGGINKLESIGLESQAQFVVDTASDWKFWLGAITVGYTFKFAKNSISKFRDKREINEN